MLKRSSFYRTIAAGLALGMIAIAAGCGNNSGGSAAAPAPAPDQTQGQPAAAPTQPAASQPGMSTRKKVVLLAGAALLYYLYKKHEAAQAAQASAPAGSATAQAAHPQLYRSRNGGIYYRDANKQPVWLTVPSQGVQVPADDLQRFAPDYNSYQGNAPQAPAGYRAQPFSDFDPSAVTQ